MDAFHEAEVSLLASNEKAQTEAIYAKEEALLTVKAERNNYRSKSISLTRELLQCLDINEKRKHVINDLREQISTQKTQIEAWFLKNLDYDISFSN